MTWTESCPVTANRNTNPKKKGFFETGFTSENQPESNEEKDEDEIDHNVETKSVLKSWKNSGITFPKLRIQLVHVQYFFAIYLTTLVALLR